VQQTVSANVVSIDTELVRASRGAGSA